MLFKRLKQDDGQVSVAVILLSVLVLAAAIGIFIFGEANDVRTRAQKAADASSLAAARDVREAFLPKFARSHVSPLGEIVGPVAPPGLPANPTVVISTLGSAGKSGAYQFAEKNGSSLSSYSATGNLFTSKVQSKEKQVVSPVGKKARESLSAPAEATAKVKTDKVFCTSPPGKYTPFIPAQPELPRTLISWQVTCTGNGHTATVKYVGFGTAGNNFYSHKDAWRKVFDIKLEN